jgi:hypothetical protein
VCKWLIEHESTFAHIAQAQLVCLMSEPTPMLHGAPCWAFISQPSVQGPLSKLFTWMLAGACARELEWEEPDFVIVIDAAISTSLLRRTP